MTCLTVLIRAAFPELTSLVPSLRHPARGGAQVRLLKGAPHLLMYAAPDTANRLVYQFLSTALELQPNVKPTGSGFATD